MMVHIDRYKRNDGTSVVSHSRRDPDIDSLKFGKKDYVKGMNILKKEFPDATHYKGRVIKVDDFGDDVKAYIPFGNSTHIEKTKALAIAGVKRDIDERELEQKKKEESYKLRYKRLKLFYYKVIRNNRATYGGSNVTVEVMEQTSKGMVNLGEVKWNTASFKGAESEVLDFLKKEGKIKKGMFAKEYYSWSDAEKYNVKISEI